MGIPGCPDLALSIASMLRHLMVFTQRVSISEYMATNPEGLMEIGKLWDTKH
jgi:hypothetical protein